MKCPCVGETDEESAYWVDSIEADRRYTSFLSCPPPIIFMVQRSQNTQKKEKRQLNSPFYELTGK